MADHINYLTPDPMLLEEKNTDGADTAAPYSYVSNRPVTLKDPRGLITMDMESAEKNCGAAARGKTMAAWSEAHSIAEEMLKDCECKAVYDKGTRRNMKDDISYTKVDPKVIFQPGTSHYHDGSNKLSINCSLNIDPCQMAVSFVHELYHWGRNQSFGASTGEGGAEDIDKVCGKRCKPAKGTRINQTAAP